MSAAPPEGPIPAAQTSDRETGLTRDDKSELRVWLRLMTCKNLLERRVRARLRSRFQITLPRFDLLSQLHRAPEGVTMGQLSQRLMVTNGNVTGLTDRLVAEGLVTRTPSPADRRTQLVRLTVAGRRLFDTVSAELESWVVDMMGGTSRSERNELLALLGRLKASLQDAANADTHSQGPTS